MNRILILSYLVFTLLLTSCRNIGKESNILTLDPTYESVDFDLEKIIERGRLIGIVENNSTGYFIYKGQTMGYEYELLKNFADYLNVELDLKITISLQEAVEMLDKGDGDIIAFPLTVTKERQKRLLFSDYQYTTRMVLVQRLPDDWRAMKLHEIENSLIRNQVDLIGKEVYVRYHSSYLTRLENLSEEIGGDIIIVELDESIETEDMIKMVSEGEIKYTVSDEDIAMVNATYYRNIDVETPVSFPTQIAWAVRLTSLDLQDTINSWLSEIKKEPTFNVIYNKYFENTRASLSRRRSEYFSIGGGNISEFDDLLKKRALDINWDWRLLASQVYQESKFDPRAKSWAGAIGLMQLVPSTAKEFGARDPYNPAQNIRAGVNYIKWLQDEWKAVLDSDEENVKFTLASYNVGLSHVQDARRLAIKYKADPDIWEGNVEKYLLLKSKPEYFNDPVVESGYCRGEEPVKYVREILSRYDQYVHNFPMEEDDQAESDSLSTIF